MLEDWAFEVEKDSEGIWLHSMDGGIDAVCAFIQHLLEKFDPKACVKFEWSHDCSKPRTDAYGGGAAVITAQEIKTMTTTQWLEQQTAHQHIFNQNTQRCIRCNQHAEDDAVEVTPCKP